MLSHCFAKGILLVRVRRLFSEHCQGQDFKFYARRSVVGSGVLLSRLNVFNHTRNFTHFTPGCQESFSRTQSRTWHHGNRTTNFSLAIERLNHSVMGAIDNQYTHYYALTNNGVLPYGLNLYKIGLSLVFPHKCKLTDGTSIMHLCTRQAFAF